MLRLSIIGAGTAATALVKALVRTKQIQVLGVLNRTKTSSQKAVDSLGEGVAIDQLAELPKADLLLIGTNDDAIHSVAKQLAQQRQDLLPNSVVFHLSGAMSSHELQPLSKHGAHIASLHPIYSFTHAQQDSERLKNTFASLEGTDIAVKTLRPLFERLGMHVLAIDPAFKLQYHGALVMICNHLVALVSCAMQLLQSAHMPEAQATALVQSLMQNTLSNIAHQGCQQALTGPFARGDWRLITAQHQAIEETDAMIAAVYQSLGQWTKQHLLNNSK